MINVNNPFGQEPFFKELRAKNYMMSCCTCCKQLVPYATYCAACGEPIQKASQILEVTECPHCGADTPSEGNFCIVCGGELKHER